MVVNILVFTAFAILWLAFGAALVLSPTMLDTVWYSFRDLPLVAQLLGGLLFLPVVLGLWIWESPWPPWLRLLLVVGLAAATLNILFPFPRQP